MRNRSRSRGFTLIELLVVVAVIALLLSILLPSLRCARAQARTAVCGTLLRSMGTGLGTYFTENDEWIPGHNTSGVGLRTWVGSPANEFIDYLRKGTTPVQSFDWISPWMRYETDMGINRAARWSTIIDTYRCPSQAGAKVNDIYNLNSRNPDATDFHGLETAFTPLSYLMPSAFQYWGQNQANVRLSTMRRFNLAITAQPADDGWSVITEDYRSRLPEVGPDPARKIAAADGTRYLEGAILDFDAAPDPSTFGSFTSSGGWWSGSTAYGVRNGTLNWDDTPTGAGGFPRSRPQGSNLPLSYRHGCAPGAAGGSARNNTGSINGLFFDGHVANMDDRTSRNIEYWYPSGSRVRITDGLTDVPRNYEIP